jgi:putative colanic acid biosynthesis UDP-glucose lipid carrier transferase
MVLRNGSAKLDEADDASHLPLVPPGRGNRGMSALRWSGGLVERLIWAGDVLLLCLAALPIGWSLQKSTVFPTRFHECAAVAALVLVTTYLLRQFGTYRLTRFRHRLRPTIDGLLAVALTAGLFDAAMTAIPHTIGDDKWLLSWAAFSALGLVVARHFERSWVVAGLRSGTLRRKIALIGATPHAERLIKQVEANDAQQPSLVLGVYDDRSLARRPASIGGIKVAGDIDTLCDYAETNPVDVIIIALPWQRAMEMFRLIQRVQWISADVMIPMDDSTINARTARIAAIAGEAALQVVRQPLPGTQNLAKITEDYVVASVAVVLLAPLMAICAIAVRLSSRGPVLSRQARVGFNGATFDMLSFRTTEAVNGRPQVTQFGRSLRKLGLHELPQLFNVLRGEMSIVGPHPHPPGMLVGQRPCSEMMPGYSARHRVKPGITGWAQVNFPAADLHSLTAARRSLDLDIAYVEGWSLTLDCRVILRSIIVAFGITRPV